MYTGHWLVRILVPQVFVAELLLLMTCLLGDYLSTTPSIARGDVLKAVTDNAVHGVVGVITWAVVIGCPSTRQDLAELVLCGVLASSVDVDHFIAARSLDLKEALSLPQRPLFHNTSLIPIISVSLYILMVGFRLQNLLDNLPWIFVAAWLSHHLRDGTRRGLWLAPFGSTPPLPQAVYIGAILTLPLLVRCWLILSRAKGGINISTVLETPV